MKTKIKILVLLPVMVLTSCNSMKATSYISNGNKYETFYDDSYFLMDNKTYHEEISLVSFSNAMSTVKTEGSYENRSSYVQDLYKKEGFTNLFINQSYKEFPGLDTIGYIIGVKQVKLEEESFNLVQLSVRSGAYKAEWASNVTVGTEGNAQGFDSASNQAKEGLYNYLKDNNITGPTKLWINGFSRGGATANLTAGKVIKDIIEGTYVSNVETTLDDIYAYCFEPPQGVLITEDEDPHAAPYNCIHNLINYNDLVPLLVPRFFGFTHYGNYYFYPDRLTDIFFNHSERKKLISNYHFMTGSHNLKDYSIDDWKFFDVGATLAAENNLPRESLYPSLGRFFRGFIDGLGYISLMTRELYAGAIEPGLRELFRAINGLNEDIGNVELEAESLINVIFSYSFLRTLMTEVIQGAIYEFCSDTMYLFYEIFGYNEKNGEAVKALYDKIWYTMFFLSAGFYYRQDLTLQFFNRDNMLGIVNAHYPSLNYSFLKSCDTRIYGKKACKLNDGSYQILHVKNPTRFKIYEEQLDKIIFTFEDGKMKSDTLACDRLADGELKIYLPNNGIYQYEGEYEEMELVKISPFDTEMTGKDPFAVE